MILNPRYKGFYTANLTEVKDYKTHKKTPKPKDEWIVYKDDKGYIITDDSGKVTGHIYAAGDCVSGHQFHQVVLAAAEGTQVALNIIKDDARIK